MEYIQVPTPEVWHMERHWMEILKPTEDDVKYSC